MTILPTLYGSFLGYAAIFACIGFGSIFLRRSAKDEIGPGYWSASFFLNCAGFLCWAATALSRPWMFFTVGEFLHILGFATLVCGAYRFAGNEYERWNIYALSGFAAAWIISIGLMRVNVFWSFFLLMLLRTILFTWAGRMILRLVPERSTAGRSLAGRSLMAWGAYVLFFPFIWRIPSLIPLAFGFLVGFHLLAAMGLVLLIIDRMRMRAEASENMALRLEGLLPICSHCKKIRDGKNRWEVMEKYIMERSEAEFSHSICPECAKTYYPEFNPYN